MHIWYAYDSHMKGNTHKNHMWRNWRIVYVCMLASLRVSMDINEGNGKIYENGIFSQLLHALTPI